MVEEVRPCELLEQVKQLAREAGDRILEIYDSEDFNIESKADDSPLTAADIASHTTIVRGVKELTPDIPVLSEESSDIAYEERSQWDWYWLIDPLDGTKEFIKRNGEFTVNIALIHAGKPVLGIVYVPVKAWMYAACEGGGATKQIGEDPPQPIRVRELPASGPVRVAGSRSHRGDSLNAFLERLGEHEMISMGSALKLCLVAEAEADVYPRLGPTSEWDTAAAQAVVEEAGGQVTDLAMQPLRYNQKDSLLNPFFLVFGDDSCNWSNYLG